MRSRRLAALALALAAGCSRPAAPPRPTPAPLFVDVTEKVGVRFVHDSGFSGGKYRFIESNPAGCALFDYDNDGWIDLLFVQSGSSDPAATVRDRPHGALYHNKGDGTFEDATAGSGLDVDLGFGHGVAVGDIDDDGDDDLFLTGYGATHLMRNDGRGKFTDVSRAWGVDRPHGKGMAMSAAFCDYDGDGKLDLYVTYYAEWDQTIDKPCADAQGDPDYCTPEIYTPESHRLYRNVGGRFVDVSDAAGIAKKTGRGLAVAWIHANGDDRPDLFVANDMSPNFLWRNDGGGRFTDVALEVGCAFAGDGGLMAAMGIGVGDYNHSGRESLFVTDFSNKLKPLFVLGANGLFEDRARTAGKDLVNTTKFLAFGATFLDFDADGWLDLAINNGHVNTRIERSPGGITYKERKQLFRNDGAGAFAEVTGPALGGLEKPVVGRGLAVGDLDNDGRLDLVSVNQNDPVQILRNADSGSHRFVSLKLVGRRHKDAILARVTLTAGGRTQTATVRGGSSYLSHSDRRVYFGLGDATTTEAVTIRWPDGVVERLTGVAPDRFHTVVQGRGIVASRPARR